MDLVLMLYWLTACCFLVILHVEVCEFLSQTHVLNFLFPFKSHLEIYNQKFAIRVLYFNYLQSVLHCSFKSSNCYTAKFCDRDESLRLCHNVGRQAISDADYIFNTVHHFCLNLLGFLFLAKYVIWFLS